MTQSKVLDRLAKLKAARDGEAALGNAEAAEAFARMINQMLLDHELNESDAQYAKSVEGEDIVEIQVQLSAFHIRQQKARIGWQEQLAHVVARAHMCRILVRPRSNAIWFVGTKAHATVAEYAYGTLVPVVDRLSDQEYYAFLGQKQREGRSHEAHGFRPAWLAAFVKRIAERFQEASDASVRNANTSFALVRLDTALAKTDHYLKVKFAEKKGVPGVGVSNRSHLAGREAGRRAADRVTLGQKGVDAPKSTERLLR